MTEPLFRLPFGLKDGELVPISAVERGLVCGCVCPACGEQLVARKGSQRQHHFAHASGAECAMAVETALHIAAKTILERRREIVLPAVRVDFDWKKGTGWRWNNIWYCSCTIEVWPERQCKLDSVDLEVHLGDITPDVVAICGGRQLIIEMRVTHKVDPQKINRIRKLGLSAIEIDLSGMARTVSFSDLETLIVEGGKHKVWLVNAKAEQIQKRYQGKPPPKTLTVY